MQVWSQGFAGLRLSLSPGWYPLATHIGGNERRRLLELLAAGVEDIDYIAEFDWPADAGVDHLDLRRTVVLVRVPASVERGDELLRQIRAKLGSVRLGLIQHATSDSWPDVAWLEREVKVPLLDWLHRQLHATTHPLARHGLANLPLDELATLTAEPIELLEMLDRIIAHRVRHGTGGLEDWRRSIAQVSVERFAARFEQIDPGQRAAALELVIVRHDQPIVARSELEGQAELLAEAGLAAVWGNDMMLGPLAQAVGKREMLPRLLRLVPTTAWSKASRKELAKAIPPFTNLPRANLVVPELAYSHWPAVIPEVPPVLFGDPPRSLGEGYDMISAAAQWDSRFLFAAYSRSAAAVPNWVESARTFLVELGDRRRFDLDLEHGHIARFDALDREFVRGSASGYLRWFALTFLLRFADSTRALDLLEDELERSREFVIGAQLTAACHALRGDLHARRGLYESAIESWTLADTTHQGVHGNWPARARSQLTFRRILAHQRLDQAYAAFALLAGLDVQAISLDESGAPQMCAELMRLQLRRYEQLGHDAGDFGEAVQPLLDQPRALQAGGELGIPIEGAQIASASVTIARAAVALEFGDWPRAIECVGEVDATLDTPEGRRALLLEATIDGTLGDLDKATSTFRALCERTTTTHDPLLLALAHRGLSSFPDASDLTPHRAALDRAIEIERELGLPDADLIEIERAGWALAGGRVSGEVFETALDRLSPIASESPALAAASMQAQLRVITLLLSSARANDEQPEATLVEGLVRLVADRVDGSALSPWFDLACEQLLALAEHQLDAGQPGPARTLLDAIDPLIAHAPRYRAQLERLAARCDRRPE